MSDGRKFKYDYVLLPRLICMLNTCLCSIDESIFGLVPNSFSVEVKDDG